jgi:DNA-binding PadR family transcriptional regulator
MNASLGNLEETILLLVLIMGEEEAYGVSVAEAYKNEIGKSISVPAVHTVLKRLEEKGMLKSILGDATPTRGGKRKRIYQMTKLGNRMLSEMRATKILLWNKVPAIKFS